MEHGGGPSFGRGGNAIETLFLPFTTGQIGGSHISGTLLGAGQAAQFGVRVVVAAPRSAKVHDLARDLGLETLALQDPARSRNPPLYDIIRTPGRAQLLSRLGPRLLVHTNDLAALQAWGPAARLVGRPIVHHNRAFDRSGTGTRAVLRLAHHVICISQACADNLSFLPESRRTVRINDFITPTTIDAGQVRAGLLGELGAPKGSRLIGFVGNFWSRKRPDFFLEAARLIADARPEARFVLFGREGDIGEHVLKMQAQTLGLSGRVLFAGFRLPPESNLAALDVLLMPALDEPFGRTLVEGLLLGVPYVASDSAGHGEIHERWGGGLLVAPEAPARAYADACLRVMEAPERVALPELERDVIGSTLRPEKQAGDLMNLYRRVVQGLLP
ncbi:MAG TPA: glycosyltransferase family 4 protein [Tepidisphaeraceae bacterium]|jgi:glycosyltransferase involved in cell wall biosynthesis